MKLVTNLKTVFVVQASNMACIESSEISAEFLESFSKVDNLSDQQILVRKYIQQFKTKTKKVSDFKTGKDAVYMVIAQWFKSDYFVLNKNVFLVH